MRLLIVVEKDAAGETTFWFTGEGDDNETTFWISGEGDDDETTFWITGEGVAGGLYAGESWYLTGDAMGMDLLATAMGGEARGGEDIKEADDAAAGWHAVVLVGEKEVTVDWDEAKDADVATGVTLGASLSLWAGELPRWLFPRNLLRDTLGFSKWFFLARETISLALILSRLGLLSFSLFSLLNFSFFMTFWNAFVMEVSSSFTFLLHDLVNLGLISDLEVSCLSLFSFSTFSFSLGFLETLGSSTLKYKCQHTSASPHQTYLLDDEFELEPLLHPGQTRHDLLPGKHRAGLSWAEPGN